MSKKLVSIIEDLKAFENRVDEITSSTSYDAIKHTVSELKIALYDHPKAIGLCAPQIGYNDRLFVVRTSEAEKAGDSKFRVFLNPILVSHEGMHLSRETNLSMPNKEFIVPRYNKIHIAYQTIDGHITSESYIGPFAEIIQQMVEMLDGITLFDTGLDLDLVGGPEAFDKASNKDKQTVISMFLDSVKKKAAEYKEEIENNSELKEFNRTIDFMSGVLAGDIKPVDEEGNIVDFSKKTEKEDK